MNNTTIIHNYRTRGRPHWRTKCGYCGVQGHNIVHCRDDTLKSFECDIFNAYSFYTLAYTNTSEIFIAYMSNFIESESLNKVKALYYSLKITPIALDPTTNEFQRTTIDVNDKASIICELIFYYISKYHTQYSTGDLIQSLFELPSFVKDSLIMRIIEILETQRDYADFNARWQVIHNTISRISTIKFDIKLVYKPVARIRSMSIFEQVTVSGTSEQVTVSGTSEQVCETCCPICLESMATKDIILLNCHHPICYTCLLLYFSSIQAMDENSVIKCCTCRAPITTMYTCNREQYGYINDKYIAEPATIEDTIEDTIEADEELGVIAPTFVEAKLSIKRVLYRIVEMSRVVYNIMVVYCFIRGVIRVF